jgi:hypothetical protein
MNSDIYFDLNKNDENELIIIPEQTAEQSRIFRNITLQYTCLLCICILILGYIIFFFLYKM